MVVGRRGDVVVETDSEDPGRRDFLFLATGAFAAVGVASFGWPLVDQMNPDASVRESATLEVDLSRMEVGQSITVTWRGKPVFVRRRTGDEIARVRAEPHENLPDPEPDSARVRRDEWLVLIGVCTHLGCVPIGSAGDYGGWFCPCHGTHYDASGRVRRGPAPKNLPVPPYAFVSDSRIRIG